MTLTSKYPISNPSNSLSELKGMFKAVNQRTKNRIRRAFNEKYSYTEDDTTFVRIMDGRLLLCYDEYMFLNEEITKHFQFYTWAKSQHSFL